MTTSDPSNGSPTGRRRRSSFTEMFARPAIDTAAANGAHSNGPRTSSMASAMQQRARRMSITSVGLSGSPNGQPPSAFDSLRSSQNLGQAKSAVADGNEDAVEDEDEVPPLNGEGGSRPTSPSVGRRLSLTSRPFRASSGASSNGDTGVTSDGSGGSPTGLSSASPPGAKKGASRDVGPGCHSGGMLSTFCKLLLTTIAEGFNWSESLRARAQRSSISAGSGNTGGFMPLSGVHARSKSVADQGGAAAPPPPQPAPPPAPKAPDHFQERILKGDFYMD